jgi:hypothetical protein
MARQGIIRAGDISANSVARSLPRRLAQELAEALWRNRRVMLPVSVMTAPRARVLHNVAQNVAQRQFYETFVCEKDS